MTQTRTRPRRGGIRIPDDLRVGPTVDVDPSAISPIPSQIMQGLMGTAIQTTTTSSEGTSLTMENLQDMVEQVSGSQPQSQYAQAAADMRMQMQATRQINQGIREANRITSPGTLWREVREDEVSLAQAPVPIRPEEASRLFPKDKDWEKLYRSRKPIEEKVSHILVHSQNKIEEVQKTLDQTENRERDIRKAIREATKQTKDVARDIRELKKRKRELELETEDQKKLRATRVIQDILALPKVKKIEVDGEKRIFITTDDMEVVKDYWEKPRVAGQYQILVDFYQSDIREGVRVLNITRRLKYQYDHPCINNTRPCFGNIEKEIRESFKERDLLEIIVTMLLYVSSPNDDTGYISYRKKPAEERHKQGWEEFLEFATPCPKDFSFRKHEKQQKSRLPTGLTMDGAPTPDLLAPVTALGSMQSVATFNYPTPSRLSPFVITQNAIDDEGFLRTLKRHIQNVIEFLNPELLENTARRFCLQFNRNGILFIKEIRYTSPDRLCIVGWTTAGWRQEVSTFPITDIRSRARPSLFFDPPPWFRDVGRSYEQEYRQEYPNTVTMNASTGIANYGMMTDI